MLHPLAAITRTRSRHLAATVGTLAVFYGSTPLVGHYVWEVSTSMTITMAMLLGLVLMCMLTSYLLSLLVGDLVFPAGWRDRLSGVTTSQERQDADVPTSKRAFKSHTVTFSALLLVVVIGNLIGANALSRGVLFEQQAIRYGTILRGDDTAQKVKALQEISQLLYEAPLKQYLPQVIDLLDTADDTIRAEATWTISEVAKRMRISIVAIENAGEPQRWEKELFEWLVAEAKDDVVMAFKTGSPAVKEAAAQALAYMNYTDAIDLYLTYIQAADPDPAVVTSICKAVGVFRSKEAIAIPIALLSSTRAELVEIGAFTLGKIIETMEPVPEGEKEPAFVQHMRTAMRAVLKGDGMLAEKCAVVESLSLIRDAWFTADLLNLFEDGMATETCPRREAKDHMGRATLLSLQEVLQLKILRALSQVAVDNKVLEPWLEEKHKDEELPPYLKEQIGNILDALDKFDDGEGGG